jgi:hypothetical protein
MRTDLDLGPVFRHFQFHRRDIEYLPSFLSVNRRFFQ